MASRSLLDRLGLAQVIPVSEVASMPWPAKPAVDSLDVLVANGHADPARFEPLAWSDDVAPGLTFLRSRAEPSLIRVEGPQVCSATVVGAARRVGADSLLFVAVEGSALRLGSRLVSVEGETLSIDALPSDEVEAQELAPSSALSSLPSLLVVAPSESYVRAQLAGQFTGIELEHWLLDEACELAERGSLAWSAAALGLVARLHEPSAEDPSALLAAVLAAKATLPSPRAAVQRWFAERSAHEINEVERDALLACDRAADSLAALSIAVEQDRPELAAMARRWVKTRDDLEALREALTVAGRSSAMDARLDQLDREASAQLSMFSQTARLDGPRWRAVSWQQPQLWWGGLAV
jgi:hypothetical protein